MKVFTGVLAVLFTLILCTWVGVRIYNGIIFGIHCGDRIKRAADANTIELATQEMEAVVSYAEKEGLTSGYTSILYRTPDEDIGFWYKNLKSSLAELKAVKPDAIQLERSNLLMKLRETLLDDTHVTAPMGISIYPRNTILAVWGWLSVLLAVIFWIWFVIALDSF